MTKLLHEGFEVDADRVLPSVSVEWHTPDAEDVVDADIVAALTEERQRGLKWRASSSQEARYARVAEIAIEAEVEVSRALATSPAGAEFEAAIRIIAIGVHRDVVGMLPSLTVDDCHEVLKGFIRPHRHGKRYPVGVAADLVLAAKGPGHRQGPDWLRDMIQKALVRRMKPKPAALVP